MKPSSVRACLVLVLLGLPIVLALGRAPDSPPRPRTVILLRHAEKDAAGDARDPTLSERGRRRAQEIARLLARSEATLLLASDLRRTRETLEPLAKELGRDVESLPAAAIEPLAQRLAALAPGATAVVAGHSNTIPQIAARLGVELRDVGEGEERTIADSDYHRVFVITLPHSGTPVAPSLLELRLAVD
jgi:phosphohistidine phosphatase SixA